MCETSVEHSDSFFAYCLYSNKGESCRYIYLVVGLLVITKLAISYHVAGIRTPSHEKNPYVSFLDETYGIQKSRVGSIFSGASNHRHFHHSSVERRYIDADAFYCIGNIHIFSAGSSGLREPDTKEQPLYQAYCRHISCIEPGVSEIAHSGRSQP